MFSFLLLALAGLAANTATAQTPAAADPAALRVERSLAHLNALRTAAGTNALERSDMLSLSASRHAAYLTDYGFRSAPSVHAEAPGLAGFSGADPFVRMRATGYRASYSTEVIGDIGSTATDSDCVDHLMRTVYHAALLLSRVTEAGAAYGTGRAAGTCVIDLGAPLAAATNAAPRRQLVRYPWPGMATSTGSLRLDSEVPRPAPALLPEANVGIPVLVGLRDAGSARADSGGLRIRIQDFEMRDANDVPVPSVILADATIAGPGIVADGQLHGGFAVLIPRRPLRAGRYRVSLHATIGTEVVAPAPWTFTVAPADAPSDARQGSDREEPAAARP
jgi:uncharacterized protein YkwD